MSNSMWMIRAEGGTLYEKFALGVVGVGWYEIGDLSHVVGRDQVRERYEAAFPEDNPGKAANGIGVLYKFRSTIEQGDKVVTYSPESRQYLIGEILTDYQFSTTELGSEWPHIRKVHWIGTVNRDDLSPSTRSSLGPSSTLFSINEDAAVELLDVLSGGPPASASKEAAKEEVSKVKEDEVAKSLELIKDAIVSLSDRAAEELVAALLTAMGYRARVTPVGPDRGVDVIASPDGLGLEEPRIKAEVKHRPKSPIGSHDVRGFLGGLRHGDRGLYVSTGGFTKEAKYEAERSTIPVTLIDLTDFASLIVTHYERFAVEGKVILPLVKIYLPAE